MSANDQVKNYQAIKVQTASPAQLIFMLYDGALRFMNLALDAMDRKCIEDQNRHLVRSQRIIAELQVSLDMEKGGEIAARLNSLYDYMYRRLIEANLGTLREPVEECIRLVAELKEAWSAVIAQEKAAAVRAVPRPQPAVAGSAVKGSAALDIAC